MNMPSVVQVRKFLTDSAFLRASSVIATPMVEEFRTTLGAAPIATIAGGRTLIGSLLLASHLKEGSVGIQFKGNGPLGRVYAETQSSGSARAYVSEPSVQLPLVENRWNVKDAIGQGLLEVFRGTPFQKSRQIGTVQIQSGEVAEDLVFYLRQSQQIPAIMNLSVEVGEFGEVVGAGGVFIELMPGHPESLISQLEKNLRSAPAISHLIEAGADAHQILEPYLKNLPHTELQPSFEIKYECRCSKERVLESMILFDHGTLDEMIEEEKPTDVQCEFCGQVYKLTTSELQEIRNRSYKNSLN